MATDYDDVCPDTICTVEGKIAAPWDDSLRVEQIWVPYTRVPARSLIELDAAYDVAQEYSLGIHVDPSRRIVRTAGDRGNTYCDYGQPSSELPVQYLAAWTSGMSTAYPIVRQSTTLREEDLGQLLGQGAAMCVGIGHVSGRRTFPGCAFGLASDHITHQNVAFIMPSCMTANMIPKNASSSEQPLMYQFMTNYPSFTRLAFGHGFTDWVRYSENEEWGMYLKHQLELHQPNDTWADVVFKAQQEMGSVTHNWHLLQKIGNIGAPSFIPPGSVVAVAENHRNGKVQLRAWPNPSLGGSPSAIELVLPMKSRVEVLVFDVSGRHVITLFDGEFGAGSHLVVWNGNTSGGTRAASGIYIIKARAGDHILTAKVIRAQ